MLESPLFKYFAYAFLFGCFVFILWLRKLKLQYGFFITIGPFGAGKTQNTTAYLKASNPSKELNITNYYTGYTDFQVQSHSDIIGVFRDIYDYHQYFSTVPDLKKLFKHKRHLFIQYLQGVKDTETHPDYPFYVGGLLNFFKYNGLTKYAPIVEEYLEKCPIDPYSHIDDLIRVLTEQGYFTEFVHQPKFNLILDEGSIYFNPRNFAKNFSGRNEELLDFIYQPRKLRVLAFVVVQSPMELDVKFRRLATYYRKYYEGIKYYRWYRDFYFMNPEEINLEQAEQIGGGPIFGGSFNFYDVVLPFIGQLKIPHYDYLTTELIRPGISIYSQGSIFKHLQDMRTIKPAKKILGFIPYSLFSPQAV
ncbi:MAG: hypothetical protein PHU93_01165 [Candidatus Gracilibacteria bacterium]|nr:hypothetical protein [Candidatus Gracilibacteria bacterium]